MAHTPLVYLAGGVQPGGGVVVGEPGAVVVVRTQIRNPLPGHLKILVVGEVAVLICLINLFQMRTKRKFQRDRIIALAVQQAQQVVSRRIQIAFLLIV